MDYAAHCLDFFQEQIYIPILIAIALAMALPDLIPTMLLGSGHFEPL